MDKPSDSPSTLGDVETCVDRILGHVGKDLKVGLPLGLGKPAELVNSLYRRAEADPTISLTLLTALSLEKPDPESGIEAAFMGPILERVFEGVVDLDYAHAVTRGKLPPNVRVLEFFFRPGSRIGNAEAQQDYISTNYTFAARDILAQGCNVVLQSVSKRESADGPRYSLSCNPDTSLELAAMLRELQTQEDRKVAIIAMVNQQLPYMALDAEVSPDFFDIVVDHPSYSSALFSTPKEAVTKPDFAIGLQASALIPDGGTLQIGIGALGDAIVHGLKLRHEHNKTYRKILDSFGASQRIGDLIERIGGTSPFDTGLYGATEMFVDGFLHLIQAGILKRPVYDFWALQQIINRGAYDPAQPPTLATLEALDEIGLRVIRGKDFAVLQHHGFFNDGTRYDEGFIVTPEGSRVVANVANPESRRLIAERCLGAHGLRRGVILHGGFFLGPRDFYQALRDMSQDQRDRICMTGVNKINQLDLNPRLYKAQRHDARFINTGMMATLSGAVVSDGLDNGQVISGVGGQYNFVAMAHQLPGGRSILMVRAVRTGKDGAPSSNIVFNYGHTTIPRHLRDIVITEYGTADLRGQTDSEVAKRLIHIADSRFQASLLAKAKDAGRIEPEYQVPEPFRHNTPDTLEDRLEPFRQSLPAFPFGSDLTDEEIALGAALKRVKARAGSTPKWKLALAALRSIGSDVPAHHEAYLQRVDLMHPTTFEDRVARTLLIEALEENQGHA